MKLLPCTVKKLQNLLSYLIRIIKCFDKNFKKELQNIVLICMNILTIWFYLRLLLYLKIITIFFLLVYKLYFV